MAARRWLAAILGTVVLGPAVAAPAPAAVVPLGAIGGEGTAAGRLTLPFGVAVDRGGRVYVGDTGNARISVFEGDGRFAFAFGWDVVPGNDDVGFEVCTSSCKAGTAGRRAGEVADPDSMAVDANGRLHVIDGHRVDVFDVAGRLGPRFLRGFGWDVIPGNATTGFEVCTATCQAGVPGDEAGQLSFPLDVDVTPAGDRIFVADAGNDRISVFGGDGRFVHAFGGGVDPSTPEGGFEVCTTATGCEFGDRGGGPGELDGVVGVALDGAGLLHAVEQVNARVSVFDPRTPSFVRAYGWDVEANGNGSAFEVCTITCKAGAAGGRAGQLTGPIGAAAGPAGGIVVSELLGQRVSRFAGTAFVDAFGWDVIPRNAALGFEVCTSGTDCKAGAGGGGFGQLRDPQDLAVDCRGAVWVAEPLNHRVQRFGEPGTKPAPCVAPAPPPPPPPPPAPSRDADRDGVLRPTDCNDADPLIRPGARDRPRDGIDQDCDGRDARFPLLRRTVDAATATYPRGRYTIFRSMDVKPVRRGDRLRLSCRGPGCPVRAKTIRVRRRAGRLSLVRHLRRARLRKGAVVQLRITRPRTIGRVSSWRIRASTVPVVKRSCLRPGARKPSRCPR